MDLQLQQPQTNDFEQLRERAYRFMALCDAYLQEDNSKINEVEKKKKYD